MPRNPDHERLERLEAALLTMPRLRREIFLAVRLDAMSYEDVARITGLSVRAVERQMARAIAHIGYHLRHGEAPPPRRWRRK
ncbi:sigma factor-like helix-turn-helix DNA-binding protein [Sphingobium sp. YBL2]|uniref:sigma-70 region 4 domain-containing protein n=1 Tax=Sphingobium sp. (strain YBL2) TaxID=484429 RepID=UPI0005CBDCDE|nr:sigma-70 region 4 domain-containing protein [Sphingobium sp. YBL2]AJR23102.1 RNA polymerase sigma factor [Sphingobium sp. YBL2]